MSSMRLLSPKNPGKKMVMFLKFLTGSEHLKKSPRYNKEKKMTVIFKKNIRRN